MWKYATCLWENASNSRFFVFRVSHLFSHLPHYITQFFHSVWDEFLQQRNEKNLHKCVKKTFSLSFLFSSTQSVIDTAKWWESASREIHRNSRDELKFDLQSSRRVCAGCCRKNLISYLNEFTVVVLGDFFSKSNWFFHHHHHRVKEGGRVTHTKNGRNGKNVMIMSSCLSSQHDIISSGDVTRI